ncbi:hypothetical protein Plhal304r1_c023g0079081 [Plasmopara halstedii]
MSQDSFMRQEIARLNVPWLQHEKFPSTKQACCSSDGLITSNKSTLIKVVQELKRGRAYMDKQLAQLDSQLLAITNYIDGSSTDMFPPHMVTFVEETSDALAPLANGRRYWSTGNEMTVPGAVNGIFSSELEHLTPALVEEDIVSDTPCTTIGLWKYLYAYSFFRTITLEDMEQFLTLEDPDLLFDEEHVAANSGHVLERSGDNLKEKDLVNADDFFKERLIASLCTFDSHSLIPVEKSLNHVHENDGLKTTNLDMAPTLPTIEDSWKSKGLMNALCEVNLLQGSSSDLADVNAYISKSDEISQKLRSLQRQLCCCIKQVNESKKKLRKIMDRTPPWLSCDQEKEDIVIKEYFAMLQSKKELARKKKLRERKLQRRQGAITPYREWDTSGHVKQR